MNQASSSGGGLYGGVSTQWYNWLALDQLLRQTLRKVFLLSRKFFLPSVAIKPLLRSHRFEVPNVHTVRDPISAVSVPYPLAFAVDTHTSGLVLCTKIVNILFAQKYLLRYHRDHVIEAKQHFPSSRNFLKLWARSRTWYLKESTYRTDTDYLYVLRIRTNSTFTVKVLLVLVSAIFRMSIAP
jgi:hypothetical protein